MFGKNDRRLLGTEVCRNICIFTQRIINSLITVAVRLMRPLFPPFSSPIPVSPYISRAFSTFDFFFLKKKEEKSGEANYLNNYGKTLR